MSETTAMKKLKKKKKYLLLFLEMGTVKGKHYAFYTAPVLFSFSPAQSPLLLKVLIVLTKLLVCFKFSPLPILKYLLHKLPAQ